MLGSGPVYGIDYKFTMDHKYLNFRELYIHPLLDIIQRVKI